MLRYWLRKNPHPPNIVFFFADDQTASSLACYGHPLVKTPTIDGLAARGTKFSNACVSQSICWVSRTTILTGLTGRSYGTPGRHDAARPEAVRELYVDLLRKGWLPDWFCRQMAR